MYRLVRCPVVIVLACVSYNVAYFFIALQQGKLSVNSVIWGYCQAMTIPAALKGDIIPWLEVQRTLRVLSG